MSQSAGSGPIGRYSPPPQPTAYGQPTAQQAAYQPGRVQPRRAQQPVATPARRGRDVPWSLLVVVTLVAGIVGIAALVGPRDGELADFTSVDWGDRG